MGLRVRDSALASSVPGPLDNLEQVTEALCNCFLIITWQDKVSKFSPMPPSPEFPMSHLHRTPLLLSPHHWPTPLNLYYRQKRSLSADVNISRWGLFAQSLLPRLRVSTNKHMIKTKQNKQKKNHMIRSLSLTLAAQQKYLGFLAKVISDSKNCFRLSVD